MKNEKELAIEKLQNALLKLPKNDLIKLLKNTYQIMKLKHNIAENNVKPKIQTQKLNRVDTNSKNMTKSNGKNNQVKLTVKSSNKQNNKTTNVKTNNNKNNKTLEECETEEGESDTEFNNLNDNHQFNEDLKEKLEKKESENENIIDKYLNCENSDEITFRSQEVEIPQLNLKPVYEYLEKKNKKLSGECVFNSDKNNENIAKEQDNGRADKGVMTPTFENRSNYNYSNNYNNLYNRYESKGLGAQNYNQMWNYNYKVPYGNLYNGQFVDNRVVFCQKLNNSRGPFYYRSKSLQRF